MRALFISFVIFSSFWVQVFAENRPKIVGGAPAPINQYPFQVALVVKQETSNFHGQFCGGSLINNNTVVTAAHCLDGEKKNSLQVLVGTHDLNNGGQRVNVKGFTIHPRYNPEKSSFDYDVAVIKLAPTPSQIHLLRSLRKARLAIPPHPSNRSSQWPPANTLVWVSGWGNLQKGDDRSPLLHHVSVNVIDQDTCRHNYYPTPITRRMICAGIPNQGGKDSCQGDSGGPLITEGNRLVGIVSWGTGCAAADYPGVYTDVTALREWISWAANL